MQGSPFPASPARVLRALAPAVLAGVIACESVGAQVSGTLVRMEGQRAEIIGITGDADLGAAADVRLGAHVADCRRTLPLSTADSARVLTHRLTTALEPNGDASRVRFVVLPAERLYLNCGRSAHDILAARGIRFASTLNASSPRIERAELRDGDRVISPASASAATLAIVGGWGVRTDSAEAMVLEYPIDAFVATTEGRWAILEFRVWTGSDTTPERLELPQPLLDRLWDHALAVRLTSLAGPRATAGLRALRDHSGYAAQADAAAALAVDGDAVAARALYERALRAAPCLSAAATSPPMVRALDASAARPVARCRAMPLRVVALRAAVLPGFGRRAERSDITGRSRYVPTIVVGSLLTAGFTMASSARSRYSRYLRANASGQPASYQADVLGYYETAESKRRTSQLLINAGAATWTASVLLDLFAERRFARRLTAEHGRVGLSFALP